MPINFPSSPALNSQYTYGGKTWSWNGYAWDIVTPTTISTLNGCTASAITITGTANEVTVDTTCPNIVIGLPNNLVVQNLTVTGSLLVSGGITTQMSEVVLIEDNFVTLNANVTAGAPTENAGIIISRGASANVDLRWNETSDNWQFTNNGTDYWDLPINVVNTFNGLTGAVSFAVPVASASVTGVASFTTADFTIGSTGNIGLTGTIARKNIDNGFSVGQSISSLGISTTYGLGSISTQWSMNSYTLATPDETATVSLPSESGIIALVDGVVTRVNGATGAIMITGAGAMLFTHSGKTGTFNARLASASATGVASFGNEFVVSALGAVSLTSNYVKSINGSTGAITNVAKTNVDNGFTLRQSISDNLGTNQVTVGGASIDFYYGVSENTQTLISSDSTSTISLPSTSGTLALVDGVATRVNGATGAITITGAGGAVLFTQSGRTGAFDVRLASASATGVASFNVADFVVGSTGHVGLTGTVARKNSDNSFSTLQTFNAGIGATGGLTAVGNYFIGSGSGAIRGIPAINYIAIGDESGSNNATQILIDDTAPAISVKCPYGVIYLGDVDGVDTGNVLEINPSGNLISMYFPEVYTNGYMNADKGYRIGSGAINAQTGTSYTLTGTDNGKIVTFNNSSAVTVTIPTGLPVGFNCTAIQLGAGQVGFTNAAGLTMQSYGNQYKMIGQHASATIIEYTTNIVNLSGNLIV